MKTSIQSHLRFFAFLFSFSLISLAFLYVHTFALSKTTASSVIASVCEEYKGKFQQSTGSSVQNGSIQQVFLQETTAGFSPTIIYAKKYMPLTLQVNHLVAECGNSLLIPSLHIESLNPIKIGIPAQNAKGEIPFTCGTGMFGGKIVFK